MRLARRGSSWHKREGFMGGDLAPQLEFAVDGVFSGIGPYGSSVVRQLSAFPLMTQGAMSQGRNPIEFLLSTPRRVLGGFLLAILMLVVVCGATVVGLSDRARNVTSVERTFSVLRTIEDLVTDVSASQLALAEFVATGDPRLLEPYEKARRSVPEMVVKLRGLMEHRPTARRQLDQLEPVLMAGLDREAREIAAR